jgi:DNA-binding NarL/FixJ family response regulator
VTRRSASDPRIRWAAGPTNKQIAGRLYLSHRTVGAHLHRAFGKLGVTTRVALRDALAAIHPE